MKAKRIKFFTLCSHIEGLEYDRQPTDHRLHSELYLNWGVKNKREYEKAAKKLEEFVIEGDGWQIYPSYDVSGWHYWMKRMKEMQYLSLTIAFDKPLVNVSEVDKIREAFEQAKFFIADFCASYDYDPSSYSNLKINLREH